LCHELKAGTLLNLAAAGQEFFPARSTAVMDRQIMPENGGELWQLAAKSLNWNRILPTIRI